MELKSQDIVPFFTFKGRAEEAMNFYVKAFPEGKQLSLDLFQPGQQGEVGKVLNGTFEVMGMKMMVMDMEATYCPEFSWATTMLINCRTESEFDDLFTALAEGGTVMMGPEAIMHLRKVAWVTDKFNVTWQMIWE